MSVRYKFVKKTGLLTIMTFIGFAFTGQSQTSVGDFRDGDFFYRVLSPQNSTVEIIGGDASYRGVTIIPDSIVHGDTVYYVVSIGENAFKGHQYRTGIQFGKYLRSIKSRAFAQQPSLLSVSLPDWVESVAEYAFADCSHLSKIHIGNGIDSIPNEAFRQSAVTDLLIGENVKWIGNNAFIGASDRLKSLTLPLAVKFVGDGAFSGHKYLTSLNLGRVEEIGDCAFGNLNYLQKLHIPSSVRIMHGNPFAYNGALKKITVDEGNPYFDSRNECNAIVNTATGVAVCCCAETQLPEGVKALTMGGSAPVYTLTIPSSLVRIDKSVLSRIDKVVINDLRQWFDISFGINPLQSAHHLYVGNAEIDEVEVPKDVETLNAYCFSGMSNLKRVKFHSGITTIGYKAFDGCSNVSEFECPWKTPPMMQFDIFDNACYNKATLIVPFGSADRYKTANIWKNFSHIKEISEISGITDVVDSDDEINNRVNMQGIPVEKSYRGIVIINRKKFLKK